MSVIAPFSPANSPVISSSLPPMTNATPPSLLEPLAPPPFNSPPSPPLSEVYPAPSVISPTSSVPPPAFPPTVQVPTNPVPTVTQVPPASSPPVIPFVPASSPPIPSKENLNPQPVWSPPSPETPTTPAVISPSPETSAFPQPPLFLRHRKVTPSRPSPTATSPPLSLPALPEAKPPAPETTSLPPPVTSFPSTGPSSSPRAVLEPTGPLEPEFSPEMKWPPPPLPATSSAPPPSSESLPVAVDVREHSEFNISSGLIVGIVTLGSILLLLVLVLCRKGSKKKQKKLYTHQAEETSPYDGSKGSHFIRLPSSNDPPHLTAGGGGAFVSVNSWNVTAVPNHVPSVAFGAVNGNFTYEELVLATDAFSEANLLGEGGFGYVYKGVLPCGKQIAVKQLKTGSQQGEREFRAEVETISRVHHKHLVKLVGYCVTRTERLLVYEFVPNNTMEFHLHEKGNPVMEWEKRIKIALGSAKGLAYLHEDCNPAIIHRDIKASNILLDFNFEVKVSDFGLAKIFPNTDDCITHLTTRVVGTFGYLAPEYASSGKLTDKSDVYSYGVMLLELITGRPPITAAGTRNESLVDWARPLLAQALQDDDFHNLVDPRLQKNYEADEMARMITCAAACVHHSARLRPRMSQIVGALEGMVSLTDLVGDITPGQTTLYSWSGSSNYDASQYQQELRNFNLALSCQKYNSSGHSESTSAYGLHLSDSSSEVQHTSQDIK